MDLNLSIEQSMLKDSVDAFARAYLSGGRTQSRSAAEGFSRETWREIVELGWLGVGLPEEVGGLGGSPVESMVIHQGMGAGLVVEPLLSAALAARLIAVAGSSEQRSSLLPAILSADALAVLAHYEFSGRGDPDFVETSATPVAGHWVLSGRKSLVVNAPSADQIIISARSEDSGQLMLFVAPAARLRSAIQVCETIDGLWAADLRLDGFEVFADERMVGAPDVAQALAEALDHATMANCAEAVGAMDAVLALTSDYLNIRHQFGVPIGSFQALQHKLADMVIAAELARSILLYGVSSLSSDDPAARARGVSAAKVRVIESAELIGAHAVQLHGAIGVSDEHIISHYFRKLTMLTRRFGGMDYHLARFGRA